MPELIKTTIYRFDELAEAAKDKARGWYREGTMSEDWHEFFYEDFETIAAMLGVQLNTHAVRLYGGGSVRRHASISVASGRRAMGPALTPATATTPAP